MSLKNRFNPPAVVGMNAGTASDPALIKMPVKRFPMPGTKFRFCQGNMGVNFSSDPEAQLIKVRQVGFVFKKKKS